MRRKIAAALLRLAKMVTADGEEDIAELEQLAREFTADGISEVLPLQYDRATAAGINRMLIDFDRLYSKRLRQVGRARQYLAGMKKALDAARAYHAAAGPQAEALLRRPGLRNFARTLSKTPKIRTRTGVGGWDF